MKYLRLGPVSYVAKTNIAEEVTISYTAKAGDKKDSTKTKDPWNYWVFQATSYGNSSGSETNQYQSVYASLSANRETDNGNRRPILFQQQCRHLY